MSYKEIIYLVQKSLNDHKNEASINEKYSNTLKYVKYINTVVQFPDGITNRYIEANAIIDRE